jgi:hypothetical protein
MFSVGAAGGLAIALTASTVLVVAMGRVTYRGEFEFLVVASVGAITGCALFVLAEQAARRVRPAIGPLTFLFTALGASLAVAVACAWAWGVFAGGPQKGYRTVARLFTEIGRDWDESVGLAISGLIPFSVAAAVRGLNPWREAPCRVWVQSAACACAGLAACATFNFTVETIREGWVLVFFTLPFAIAPVAMAAGKALEDRLVARWKDRP